MIVAWYAVRLSTHVPNIYIFICSTRCLHLLSCFWHGSLRPAAKAG